MAYRPNLLTIAPGSPFLETLADALLDGRLVPGFAHLWLHAFNWPGLLTRVRA